MPSDELRRAQEAHLRRLMEPSDEARRLQEQWNAPMASEEMRRAMEAIGPRPIDRDLYERLELLAKPSFGLGLSVAEMFGPIIDPAAPLRDLANASGVFGLLDKYAEKQWLLGGALDEAKWRRLTDPTAGRYKDMFRLPDPTEFSSI